MSENELLFYFLIGIIVVAIGTMILSILQWRRVDQEVRITSRQRTLRGKNQPSVTVLVYAYNQEKNLERILRAIKYSYYHAFDVVVVDDASDDNTSKAARAFITKNPKMSIRLLRRRKRTSEVLALQAAYRKSKRGSVVIPITPYQTVDKYYIKRAVASRQNRDEWQISTSERLGNRLTILDIGIFLSKYLWQHTQHFPIYDSAYFMRRETKEGNNLPVRAVRDGVGVVVLILLLSSTFTHIGVQALWYVWILITTYGLLAVWLRYGETLRDRIVLTLSLPLALFLVPATSVLRGISQLLTRK